MADPRDFEWFSLNVIMEYLIFVSLAVPRILVIGLVRALLTFDACLGGSGRFVISNADMVVREEWSRLSTVDSALSGTQILAATMLSHASAFPTRAAIADLNKKESLRPNEIPTMWVRVLQRVPHNPLTRSGAVFHYSHSPRRLLGLVPQLVLAMIQNGRNLIGHNRFYGCDRNPLFSSAICSFASFWCVIVLLSSSFCFVVCFLGLVSFSSRYCCMFCSRFVSFFLPSPFGKIGLPLFGEG